MIRIISEDYGKHISGINNILNYLETLGDKFNVSCSSNFVGTGKVLAKDISIDDVYDIISGNYENNSKLNKMNYYLRGWNMFDAAVITNRKQVKLLDDGIEYRGKKLKDGNWEGSFVTFKYNIYVS